MNALQKACKRVFPVNKPPLSLCNRVPKSMRVSLESHAELEGRSRQDLNETSHSITEALMAFNHSGYNGTMQVTVEDLAESVGPSPGVNEECDLNLSNETDGEADADLDDDGQEIADIASISNGATSKLTFRSKTLSEKFASLSSTVRSTTQAQQHHRHPSQLLGS